MMYIQKHYLNREIIVQITELFYYYFFQGKAIFLLYVIKSVLLASDRYILKDLSLPLTSIYEHFSFAIYVILNVKKNHPKITLYNSGHIH